MPCPPFLASMAEMALRALARTASHVRVTPAASKRGMVGRAWAAAASGSAARRARTTGRIGTPEVRARTPASLIAGARGHVTKCCRLDRIEGGAKLRLGGEVRRVLEPLGDRGKE